MFFRRSSCAPSAWTWTTLWLIAFGTTQAARGDDEVGLARVEEDWELVIGQPDLNSSGPQVTTVISPYGHLLCCHAQFELNHRTLPDTKPGGLALQSWIGEDHFASRTHGYTDLASQYGEVVRWTQALEIADGKLVLEIKNGQSATWGAFGTGGTLRESIPTSLANLNGYDPQVSIDNSGVSFAGHCVQSLVLKRLRVTTQDDQTLTLELNISVHAVD